LGELGDARAFAPLTHILAWDRNTNVRDGAVRGLAMLGDPRALPVLLPLVNDDPGLNNTAEALVRLRALARQLIGGADLSPNTKGLSGFAQCQRGPLRHDWDFLHRTSCTSERARSTLWLSVPKRVADAPSGNDVLVSVKRTDSTNSVDVELRIGE